MSQENVEVVRRHQNAFNRRDMVTLLELTDPNVEWWDRADDPDAAVHRGHDAVTKHLAGARGARGARPWRPTDPADSAGVSDEGGAPLTLQTMSRERWMALRVRVLTSGSLPSPGCLTGMWMPMPAPS